MKNKFIKGLAKILDIPRLNLARALAVWKAIVRVGRVAWPPVKAAQKTLHPPQKNEMENAKGLPTATCYRIRRR